MSARYFDRLAKFATMNLDTYQNQMVNHDGGDYSWGEHMFYALFYDYLATQRLTIGFAGVLQDLASGMIGRWTCIKRAYRRFDNYEMDVELGIGRENPHSPGEYNAFNLLASLILQLEEFNSNMRMVEGDKALGYQVRLSLCLECGRLVPQTVAVPASTCGPSCRNALAKGGIFKDVIKKVKRTKTKSGSKFEFTKTFATGKDASGLLMLSMISREYARILSNACLDKCDEMGKTKAWESSMKKWSRDSFTSFEHYGVAPRKNKNVISGVFDILGKPKHASWDYTAVSEEAEGYAVQLSRLMEADWELYEGEIGDVLRNKLFNLDPNHPMASLTTFAPRYDRKRYFTTAYIREDGSELPVALRVKRDGEDLEVTQNGKKGKSIKLKHLADSVFAELVASDQGDDTSGDELQEFVNRLVTIKIGKDGKKKQRIEEAQKWRVEELTDQNWEEYLKPLEGYSLTGKIKGEEE